MVKFRGGPPAMTPVKNNKKLAEISFINNIIINMTTKKEVLIKKYIDYQNQMKQIIDCNILPSLDDFDILDILLYFNLYFNIGQPDYEKVIRDIIEMNKLNIDQNDLNKVMPITLDLIEWLIKFQKIN